jgi:hypothetical protein
MRRFGSSRQGAAKTGIDLSCRRVSERMRGSLTDPASGRGRMYPHHPHLEGQGRQV